MSARAHDVGHATTPADSAGRTGATDQALELVVAGLASDQDALLGDLTEGRAGVASAQGERAARHWWRRQALLAVPVLAWHGLVHRPLMWLLGLTGFVAWTLLTALVPAPFGTDVMSYDALHPSLPSVTDIVADTVVIGIGTLVAAAVAGAGTAALARRARLVPALVTAALMMLVSTRSGFHVVLGPGRCEEIDRWTTSCTVELGAASRDAIVPALWQLPTMMTLLPVATTVGALAVVAWSRRRRGVEPAPD
ncbi:hypothetical protein [Actinotalea sp. K2]|uniref:hypothetical protein n=1 Tax=Actinotalea sp. K2 TaxID=2939438 RepID=UPI0020183D86|nr:hypothetical protein [Actinotalea sp. K2]MCL3860938.1 hypothetical protein [Actinotalea sp. K2]